MAAFILRWCLSSDISEDTAAALLTGILLQVPSGISAFSAKEKPCRASADGQMPVSES